MLAMFQFSFLNVGKIGETQPAWKKSKYPIYEIKYLGKTFQKFCFKTKEMLSFECKIDPLKMTPMSWYCKRGKL